MRSHGFRSKKAAEMSPILAENFIWPIKVAAGRQIVELKKSIKWHILFDSLNYSLLITNL